VSALAVAVVAVGCGDGDGRVSAPRVYGRDATPTSLAPGHASDYVGLTEAAAKQKAATEGRPARVLRRDDEHFPATQDYNPDRVNLEIDDGKVTKATFG
jgi:hypothetical protein